MIAKMYSRHDTGIERQLHLDGTRTRTRARVVFDGRRAAAAYFLVCVDGGFHRTGGGSSGHRTLDNLVCRFLLRRSQGVLDRRGGASLAVTVLVCVENRAERSGK
jgi:hypothetical protein